MQVTPILLPIFILTRNSQKYTETLLRMLFCESLRRLRETIPPHGSLLPSTSFQSRMALLTTNYSLIQLRTALVKID